MNHLELQAHAEVARFRQDLAPELCSCPRCRRLLRLPKSTQATFHALLAVRRKHPPKRAVPPPQAPRLIDATFAEAELVLGREYAEQVTGGTPGAVHQCAVGGHQR